MGRRSAFFGGAGCMLFGRAPPLPSLACVLHLYSWCRVIQESRLNVCETPLPFPPPHLRPQIVSGLTRGQRPPIPQRDALPGPDSTSFAGLDAYCALMQHCWEREPAQRPDFADIVQCLRGLLAAAAV